MKTEGGQNIRLLDPLPVPHFFANILLVPGFKGPESEESENKARGEDGREKEETRDDSLLERNLDRFVMTRGLTGT